jgi:hypothetical protein
MKVERKGIGKEEIHGYFKEGRNKGRKEFCLQALYEFSEVDLAAAICGRNERRKKRRKE